MPSKTYTVKHPKTGRKINLELFVQPTREMEFEIDLAVMRAYRQTGRVTAASVQRHLDARTLGGR